MAVLNVLDRQELAAVTASPGIQNEDLDRKIWDLSRVPLPGLDRIGRGTVFNVKYEWVRDRLAAAADNVWAEGASYAASASTITDFTNSATAPLNRFINYTQNSVKAVAVSDIAQAMSTPGGIGGEAANLVIANRELMQDMEFIIFCNSAASVAPIAQTTAARTASYVSILDTTAGPVTSTTFFSAASANPWDAGGWTGSVWAIPTQSGGGAATNGALSEADVRDCCMAIFKNGKAAGPNAALFGYTGPEVKRKMSEYYYTSTAKAAPLIKTSGDGPDQKAVGSIELIITDYGTVELEASRFFASDVISVSTALGQPLWIFNPDYFEMVYLIPPHTTQGPNLGLGSLKWTSAVWGTRFHPEACAGVVNIDRTLAMTTT